MTTLKEGLKKASANMKNPCFICEGNGVWGFGLECIANKANGRPVKVYDCPEEYRPECEDDWPAEQWLAAQVDPDGYIWPLDGKKAVMKTQGFLWDAFSDADAVGVKLDDLLSWPGLATYYGLTQKQIDSVEAHYYAPEKWTKQDEEARDKVAAATDSEDFEALYSWLVWAVGDQTAEGLVEDWEQSY